MESEFQEREIYGTLTLRIAEVYIGTGFDEESHNVVLDSACCLKVHIPVVLEQKPVLEVKLYQIHKFFLVGSFSLNVSCYKLVQNVHVLEEFHADLGVVGARYTVVCIW